MSAEGRTPKALLERYGLRPKYHFGQNFLADDNLARRIALACRAAGGTVIELGAGLGALTRPLLETEVARLAAVERDRDLIEPLAREFAAEVASGRLEIVEADAKTVPLEPLFARGPAPHVLAGNLPYQISGPLLQRAVRMSDQLVRAVFLLQLEVAARLGAAPNSEDYGALSVFTQRAFRVEKAFAVRRGAFYPQPNVDSAVVVLEPRPGVGVETVAFQQVVKAAFAQRRKQLRNAWSAVFGGRGKDLAACAARAGIDLGARGETLSVAEFGRMASELER